MVEYSDSEFKKKLMFLTASQKAIDSLSTWCLERHEHYKSIITIWSNTIKNVKIKRRLLLFYLANHIIQYSKKQKYKFVDKWKIAIQKAIPYVRDEKILSKILRVIKIWKERNVYNHSYLADLTGLLSTKNHELKFADPVQGCQACFKNAKKVKLLQKKLKSLIGSMPTDYRLPSPDINQSSSSTSSMSIEDLNIHNINYNTVLNSDNIDSINDTNIDVPTTIINNTKSCITPEKSITNQELYDPASAGIPAMEIEDQQSLTIQFPDTPSPPPDTTSPPPDKTLTNNNDNSSIYCTSSYEDYAHTPMSSTRQFITSGVSINMAPQTNSSSIINENTITVSHVPQTAWDVTVHNDGSTNDTIASNYGGTGIDHCALTSKITDRDKIVSPEMITKTSVFDHRNLISLTHSSHNSSPTVSDNQAFSNIIIHPSQLDLLMKVFSKPQNNLDNLEKNDMDLSDDNQKHPVALLPPLSPPIKTSTPPPMPTSTPPPMPTSTPPPMPTSTPLLLSPPMKPPTPLHMSTSTQPPFQPSLPPPLQPMTTSTPPPIKPLTAPPMPTSTPLLLSPPMKPPTPLHMSTSTQPPLPPPLPPPMKPPPPPPLPLPLPRPMKPPTFVINHRNLISLRHSSHNSSPTVSDNPEFSNIIMQPSQPDLLMKVISKPQNNLEKIDMDLSDDDQKHPVALPPPLSPPVPPPIKPTTAPPMPTSTPLRLPPPMKPPTPLPMSTSTQPPLPPPLPPPMKPPPPPPLPLPLPRPMKQPTSVIVHTNLFSLTHSTHNRSPTVSDNQEYSNIIIHPSQPDLLMKVISKPQNNLERIDMDLSDYNQKHPLALLPPLSPPIKPPPPTSTPLLLSPPMKPPTPLRMPTSTPLPLPSPMKPSTQPPLPPPLPPSKKPPPPPPLPLLLQPPIKPSTPPPMPTSTPLRLSPPMKPPTSLPLFTSTQPPLPPPLLPSQKPPPPLPLLLSSPMKLLPPPSMTTSTPLPLPPPMKPTMQSPLPPPLPPSQKPPPSMKPPPLPSMPTSKPLPFILPFNLVQQSVPGGTTYQLEQSSQPWRKDRHSLNNIQLNLEQPSQCYSKFVSNQPQIQHVHAQGIKSKEDFTPKWKGRRISNWPSIDPRIYNQNSRPAGTLNQGSHIGPEESALKIHTKGDSKPESKDGNIYLSSRDPRILNKRTPAGTLNQEPCIGSEESNLNCRKLEEPAPMPLNRK